VGPLEGTSEFTLEGVPEGSLDRSFVDEAVGKNVGAGDVGQSTTAFFDSGEGVTAGGRNNP